MGGQADPAETSAAKAAARTEAYARRKAAHATGAAAAAEAAAARLFAALGETALAGRVVSGYRPIRTEIDPTPAMRALIARGARVCVPAIVGAGQPLRFLEWTPESRMIVGAFGAEIPAEGADVEPTLLIAPLLAFDCAGYRLGYGGGFYDRTLARLRALRRTRAIGFAYAAQEVAAVPIGPSDARLDAIVTEAETLRLQPDAFA